MTSSMVHRLMLSVITTKTLYMWEDAHPSNREISANNFAVFF